MALTWRDFVGPVSIFVDERWQNGKLVSVRANDVVYTISGDPDMYIISKDEAYSIIRKRSDVTSFSKGKQYTGSNPLIFGPSGASIYGRKIVERKDRPGIFRVHIKYQPNKSMKVKNVKINLGKHVRSVCCYFFLYFFLLCFCLFLFRLTFIDSFYHNHTLRTG